MYGITMTHDSTGYAGGGKAAANPFCWDWVVTGCYVDDVNWIGIDCHGAYEIIISHNKVYDCMQGIAIPTGSGAAAVYAGWNNQVIHNIIDARHSDSTSSGRELTGYGINVNGGATEANIRVIVADNIIYGYGVASNANTGAIQSTSADNIIIHDNIIEHWGRS